MSGTQASVLNTNPIFNLRRQERDTYMVWSDGGIFHADSLVGGSDYRSINLLDGTTMMANVVAAVNALGGGSIFLKDVVPVTSLSVKDVSNIIFRSKWNQGGLKCIAPAGVALNIGDQNATDATYHAQNIVVDELLLDGGYPTVTNGAALGIATAFNVIVKNCFLQNSGEVGTGGFRLTNWNATQSLSKNVWVQRNYLNGQKITLSGVINCWCDHNVFDGTSGTAGTRALVDFSKGDFSPLSANRITNTHFDDNTIYGWTQIGGGVQGLQALQGCTISRNYWDGLKTLINSTDAAAPYDLNGLTVERNEFWNCTGGMNIGFGDRIRIISNRLMTDSTPANSSTGITVLRSAAGVTPTNVEIEDNLLYKWGGVGMLTGFTRGSIKRNKFIDNNQAGGSINSNAGLLIDATLAHVDILDNGFYATPSNAAPFAGVFRAILYNGAAANCRLANNRFFLNSSTGGGGIFFGVPRDPTFIIENNYGYNPSPITNIGSSTAQLYVKAGAPVDGDFINPQDGTSVIDTTNNKIWSRVSGVWKARVLSASAAGAAAITVTASPFTYTNNDGVPEAVYIDAGTVSAIAKNSITVYTSTGKTVLLEPSEAVTVTYTVAPTMNKDQK